MVFVEVHLLCYCVSTQYSGVIPGMDGLGYNLCYYDANKSNSKTFYYLSNYNNA